jgi:amino acid transporter
MAAAIGVRSDYTAAALRRFARRSGDADQVRRLLAVAMILDGGSGVRRQRFARHLVSLISVATLGNVMVMQFPRVLYAIARDDHLPGLLTVANNGTPRMSLMVTAALAALPATIGIYDFLLSISVSLVTAMSVSINVAAIVMRIREAS